MIDVLPSSRVSRAFGSEVAYSDALSNVHKFNARLLRERRLRLRLPFVDSQTHIIQSPTQNHLWKQPSQRLVPSRHDQVACYARKEWHKRRPHPRPTVTQSQASNSSNHVGGTNEISADSIPSKSLSADGTIPGLMEDDPRVLVRAGELGKQAQASCSPNAPLCLMRRHVEHGYADHFDSGESRRGRRTSHGCVER